MQTLAALFCGILFGLGLAISGMTNPAKVIGFLDFTGRWDPSLGLVMGGALLAYAAGFPLTQKRAKPLFAKIFQVPKRTDLDAPLIGGAALFGMGWGIAGFCPGPALTALAFGFDKVFIFVAAMTVGSLLYGVIGKSGRKASRSAA